MALFSLSERWRRSSVATRASNLVQLTFIERVLTYSSWAATACRGSGDAVLGVEDGAAADGAIEDGAAMEAAAGQAPTAPLLKSSESTLTAGSDEVATAPTVVC